MLRFELRELQSGNASRRLSKHLKREAWCMKLTEREFAKQERCDPLMDRVGFSFAFFGDDFFFSLSFLHCPLMLSLLIPNNSGTGNSPARIKHTEMKTELSGDIRGSPEFRFAGNREHFQTCRKTSLFRSNCCSDPGIPFPTTLTQAREAGKLG